MASRPGNTPSRASLGLNDSPDSETLGKYYTKLSFYDYSRQNPFTAGADGAERIAGSTIFLPLPIQLYDRTSSSFSQQNLGVIGDLLNLSESPGNLASSEFVTSGLLRVLGPGIDVASFATLGPRLSSIVDSSAITTSIEQLVGAVPNPNPVVKYNGPQLRSFNYTWYLSPKNETESKSLRSILNLLRRSSLGGKQGGSTALLTIPKLIQMNFLPWDNGSSSNWGWTDKSIIRMKRCHVTNVSVNYNPANVPAFFRDNNPVIVELSIELLEVEYMFEESWRDNPLNNKEVFGTEPVLTATRVADLTNQYIIDPALNIASDVVGNVITNTINAFLPAGSQIEDGGIPEVLEFSEPETPPDPAGNLRSLYNDFFGDGSLLRFKTTDPAE